MASVDDLTPRERQVLKHLILGPRATEIAAQLDLDRRTVERHLGHAYAKISVHHRAEATRWALEHGVG